MPISYGTTSKRISAGEVHSIVTSNMTILAEGEDSLGGYYLSAYINSNAPGCGSPNFPVMSVNIKNEALLGWKKVTFKTYGTFITSCWSLNENAYSNNISSYSAVAGDRIFKSKNCFELPQFAVKTTACDNESDNAFHSYNVVGTYREWYQTRRRDSLTAIAGPSIELGCNSVGESFIITFSDIYVCI